MNVFVGQEPVDPNFDIPTGDLTQKPTVRLTLKKVEKAQPEPSNYSQLSLSQTSVAMNTRFRRQAS